MPVRYHLSELKYKKRIEDSDFAVQIIKLADVVHNCSELNDRLSYKTIKRKIDDGDFYLELANKLSESFSEKLNNALRNKFINL